MLDMETLATTPDAVILTVGAIRFDPHTISPSHADLYLRINVDEQLALGRQVNNDTIDWWGKQDPLVRDEALSDDNRVSLDHFTSQLNKFLVGVDNIWAQGPVFDIVMLENLYRQLGKPVPWNYWQIRDSRTLFGTHGDPREKGRTGHHNALDDCKYQALGVQQIFTRYNIEKGQRWK